MLVILVIDLLADKIFFSPMERSLHRRWGRRKNGRVVQPFNRFPIATARNRLQDARL